MRMVSFQSLTCCESESLELASSGWHNVNKRTLGTSRDCNMIVTMTCMEIWQFEYLSWLGYKL